MWRDASSDEREDGDRVCITTLIFINPLLAGFFTPKMEKITVRPATRADIEAFAGRSNNETIRGFVGELNGKVIAQNIIIIKIVLYHFTFIAK